MPTRSEPRFNNGLLESTHHSHTTLNKKAVPYRTSSQIITQQEIMIDIEDCSKGTVLLCIFKLTDLHKLHKVVKPLTPQQLGHLALYEVESHILLSYKPTRQSNLLNFAGKNPTKNLPIMTASRRVH